MCVAVLRLLSFTNKIETFALKTLCEPFVKLLEFFKFLEFLKNFSKIKKARS